MSNDKPRTYIHARGKRPERHAILARIEQGSANKCGPTYERRIHRPIRDADRRGDMPCLPPACFAWHRLAWPNGGHAATTEQATARKEEIMQRTRGRGRHMHAAARGQLLMDRSTDEHAHTKPIVQAKLAHTGPDMLSRCPVGACPPLDKEPRHTRARVSCPPLPARRACRRPRSSPPPCRCH
jgi:hypothetical protein